MKKDITTPWIELGYEAFATKGANSLRIEPLAKAIGKNKSSFYHLFADLEVFTEYLLDHHLDQAKIMAEKEFNCGSREEFIQIILDHKTDLLFNRQLRIHRDNKRFEKCMIETNQISARAIVGIWAKIIDLQNDSFLAELVYKLSLDNFFLQITEESIHEEWLNNYFDELKTLVKAFKNKGKTVFLDGSV